LWRLGRAFRGWPLKVDQQPCHDKQEQDDQRGNLPVIVAALVVVVLSGHHDFYVTCSLAKSF
jgi:hypothetical protein